MLKLRISALIVILLAALLGGVFFFSYQITTNSPELSRNHHDSINRSLLDQRSLASLSLNEQAEQLAGDATLQNLIKDVRNKLSVTPLSELKAITQNEWNTPVFKYLLAWLQRREAYLAAGAKNTTSSIPSLADWWGRAPDLLLAFSMTPLNDGSIAPILVAHAKEGMALQGGQRYDFPLLSGLSNTHQPALGLLPWSKSIYLALAYPVYSEGVLVGSIVLGKELNADFVESFSRNLPANDKLLLYYNPNKGDAAIRYYSPKLTENDRLELTSAKFLSAASKSTDETTISALAPNTVYNSTLSQGSFSISKSTWLKDDNQDFGFYLVANDSLNENPTKALRTKSLILACLLAILGLIISYLLIQRSQRSIKELSLALWESMNSDKAIDYDALKKHADIKSLVLVVEQLILKTTRDDSQSPDGESWNELMVNLEDESNELSGEFTRAQLPQFQTQAAAPEDEALRPLYNEFIKKRLENNQNDDMDFDKFVRRVKRNKKQIQDSYHCKEVGFDIVVSQGKVVLKPKILD